MSKRTCPTEHEEQVAVMDWARAMTGTYPCLAWLHAIPNGGKRNVIVAMKLKAEGVKSGVSDLFLPFPACGKNGLYIEMKALDGKVSEAQTEFLEYANGAGYLAAVCWGAEEAINLIAGYVNGKEPLPF